jgi:RNA polymerase sigma-70 factor (ECF subfamily)
MPRRSRSHVPLPAAPPPLDLAPLSEASQVASGIKRLLAAGHREEARERFTTLVDLLHRRALRIAYGYLRDAGETEEAVQDAFLKVFLHMTSYSEARPFEVWFTRILINGCLDRQKARGRRLRWMLPLTESDGARRLETVSAAPSPEARLLSKAKAGALGEALAELPPRQRQVFVLRHLSGQSPADVSEALGLTEATVRVHLFRALRRLRELLER